MFREMIRDSIRSLRKQHLRYKRSLNDSLVTSFIKSMSLLLHSDSNRLTTCYMKHIDVIDLIVNNSNSLEKKLLLSFIDIFKKSSKVLKCYYLFFIRTERF